jgi:hypothetical protein
MPLKGTKPADLLVEWWARFDLQRKAAIVCPPMRASSGYSVRSGRSRADRPQARFFLGRRTGVTVIRTRSRPETPPRNNNTESIESVPYELDSTILHHSVFKRAGKLRQFGTKRQETTKGTSCPELFQL